MDKQALCLSYLMGEATEEQVAELSDWIKASPENAKMFALLAAQDASLSVAVAQHCAPVEKSSNLLDELAELEKMSEPATLVDVTESVIERQQREAALQAISAKSLRLEKASGKQPLIVVIPKAVVWLGLAAVVALAATLLFYLTPPNDRPGEFANPSNPENVAPPLAPAFAAVVRDLDTRWETGGESEGLLSEGEHVLAEGIVELELLSGTRVIVEAPASFVLTGVNTMDLHHGRAVATVPDTTTSFVLDTPDARLAKTAPRVTPTLSIDFSIVLPNGTQYDRRLMDVAGTVVDPAGSSSIESAVEFGVHVERDRQTLAQVFRGQIQVSGVVNNAPSGEPVALVDSEAALISAQGTEVAFVEFDQSAFRREITTRLQMVDLIMGGDGTTHRQNIGLNPLTGRYERNLKDNRALIGLLSTGRMQPVAGNPYVAGVFVPSKDGHLTGLPAGLSLQGLPETNGYGYGVIWSGHEMPGLDQGLASVPTKLPGYNFAGAGKQALVMHTNAGFMIDLDAIRRANPGFEIVAVKAVAGNSSLVDHDNAWDVMLSSFYAYLDSDLVLNKTFDLSDADQPRTAVIELSIAETNRYLTFASTDGGDGNHQDWIVLGDPVVVLKPIEKPTHDF